MTRREARELAFVLLFEKNFTEETVGDILEKAAESRDVKPDAFSVELAEGAANKLEELDAAIEPALHNWSKSRLSCVALTVMRLAVYEMRYCESIPTSVAINEAVEIAKKYGGAEDAAFINGVLGTVAQAQ